MSERIAVPWTDDGVEVTSKPVIPVEVHCPVGHTQLGAMTGLVDTGASHTYMPVFLIPMLGIPQDACTPFSTGWAGTDGGEVQGWELIPDMELEAFGRRITIRGRFMHLPFQNLTLGTEDFMHHFRVEVDQRERMTYLTPYDDDAYPPEASVSSRRALIE